MGGSRPCFPLATRIAKMFLTGICWQALVMQLLPLRTFSQIVTSDVTPIVRAFLKSAGKFLLHSSFLFARFLGSSTSDVTPIVRAFLRSADKFLLHSSFLFVRFLGSSTSDVIPIVRSFLRSAGKFLLHSSFL
ncbi:hypothetical protein PanWU01x14_339280, partial [Parasponia andersonii]